MLAQSLEVQSEAAFGVDELFFSRTDERGVILAGNTVFQRVAGFDWDELIGAPHKIIRHPDMPKAVFWILWDRLKAGRPVGAYVKNRTKDGGYYWVYAMVTPVPGGYLSVRIKPTSELLGTVEKLYAQLREEEGSDDSSTVQSVSTLSAALADLGFRDYAAFMAHSVAQEFCSRNQLLSRRETMDHGAVQAMLQATNNSLHEAVEVFQFFKHIRDFPVNLGIQATRLPGAGKIFGVIAADFGRFCQNIETNIRAFLDSSVRVTERITDGVFLLYAAQVQQEMAGVFEGEEAGAGDIDFTTETILLRKQAESFLSETRTNLDLIVRDAKSFHSQCSELLALASALDVARTIGSVESARLNEQGRTLQDMMSEAGRYQEAIAKHLTRLEKLNRETLDRASALSSGI